MALPAKREDIIGPRRLWNYRGLVYVWLRKEWWGSGRKVVR
jgi:hypothetical protein